MSKLHPSNLFARILPCIFLIATLLLSGSLVSSHSSFGIESPSPSLRSSCPMPVPLLGWSTWNTFQQVVNETLIRQSADAMRESALYEAGYNYILLDDGWTSCLEKDDKLNCLKPGPRDENNRIVPDPERFPSGMKALADYVHSKGLKIGIYTAVSATTCGGYMASLGYEAIDAQTFADWGFDFVKHDTCNTDCGIHDGCMQDSTMKMSQGLKASGRDIIYYIDGGNPTGGPRVANPTQTGVTNPEAIAKLARKKEELIWYGWGAERGHMFKSWFDRSDSWYSLLDNVHNQIGLSLFHSCCAYHYPDMLTVGMGGLTESEGRVEMFLMVMLATPIILGCDIRFMDPTTAALVTHKSLIEALQDPACSQGNLVRDMDSGETWVRSLSDGSFVAVLINKDDQQSKNVSLHIGTQHNGGDFFPAAFPKGMMLVDIYTDQVIGFNDDTYTVSLKPHDGQILRLAPVGSKAADKLINRFGSKNSNNKGRGISQSRDSDQLVATE